MTTNKTLGIRGALSKVTVEPKKKRGGRKRGSKNKPKPATVYGAPKSGAAIKKQVDKKNDWRNVKSAKLEDQLRYTHLIGDIDLKDPVIAELGSYMCGVLDKAFPQYDNVIRVQDGKMHMTCPFCRDNANAHVPIAGRGYADLSDMTYHCAKCKRRMTIAKFMEKCHNKFNTYIHRTLLNQLEDRRVKIFNVNRTARLIAENSMYGTEIPKNKLPLSKEEMKQMIDNIHEMGDDVKKMRMTYENKGDLKFLHDYGTDDALAPTPSHRAAILAILNKFNETADRARKKAVALAYCDVTDRMRMDALMLETSMIKY